MANKNLFSSALARVLPRTDAVNEAGGNAYAYGPQALLAQLAATGTLSDGFYADAQDQLAKALDAAPCRIKRAFGYVREWNFQSATAQICALGLRRAGKVPALDGSGSIGGREKPPTSEVSQRGAELSKTTRTCGR